LATLLFRKETGHTILDVIRSRRFENICNLLSQTSLPISAVIDQSGYASESFAKRFFRKNTGMTMKEWRKSQG
jgi:AraC-like DNA-binding protein